jgi:hypothetical protein
LAHRAKRKSKGTELDVFRGRAARANSAIFEILAKESSLNIKEILKKITRYEGLEETYYASLTKRLRCLKEKGLIEEVEQAQNGTKQQTEYELQIKAYLAMLLGEFGTRYIFNKASKIQSAQLLLILMDIVFGEDKPFC